MWIKPERTVMEGKLHAVFSIYEFYIKKKCVTVVTISDKFSWYKMENVALQKYILHKKFKKTDKYFRIFLHNLYDNP